MCVCVFTAWTREKVVKRKHVQQEENQHVPGEQQGGGRVGSQEGWVSGAILKRKKPFQEAVVSCGVM